MFPKDFLVVVVVDAVVSSFMTFLFFVFSIQRQLDRLMDFIDINDDGEIEFRYFLV